MTKEEVLILINKKIKEAKETAEENHGHNTYSWSTYYSGVARGLEDAKGILGMLDKPNKVSV